MSETKSPAMLAPSRIQQADFRETRYRVEVERGTTLDEIRHPLFWAHVAKTLRPHDMISVVADDNSMWAELLVLSVGKERAFVAVVKSVDVNAAIDDLLKIEGAVETDSTVPKVEWKGPQAKYCVVRGDAMVQKGFATKAEALAWLTAADKKAA